MRWSCLQHVPFEGPGYLDTWSRGRGHELRRVEVWSGAPLPETGESDGLFILGGPMNVYEEDRYPWLAPEKRFIERILSEGKPILGICLGAQLLAVVLGGVVSENTRKEIGWFPVQITPEGRKIGHFAGFPDDFMAFHWHGDRFSIPEGAVLAASSEACAEQAFVYGERVVGLQFHLESTEKSIQSLVQHCGEEITCGPYVQDPPTMEEFEVRLPDTHVLLACLLDRLVPRA